jgi:hypothetical protein
MKVLKHRVLESFKTEIKKLEARELDEVANSIAKILSALKEAKIGSYKRHSDDLLFDGSGWEKHVILHVAEIKETIEDLSSNCRDRLLSKLTQTSRKVYEQSMKEFIHSHIQTLPENLNGLLKDDYTKEVKDYNRA